MRKIDWRDSFRADSKTIFFHEHVVTFTRNTINENLDWLKKSSGGVRRFYAHAARLIVAMTTSQIR